MQTTASNKPDLVERVIDLLHNVGGLSDGALASMSPTALRELIREYRADARALLDKIDQAD